MDDVKAVIEQATDAAMGTPPEAPAEAPKPEMKKVRRAAKKVARKVGPKNKVGKEAKKSKSAKKSAKKAPKKAKAKKKKAKKAKRLGQTKLPTKVRGFLLSSLGRRARISAKVIFCGRSPMPPIMYDGRLPALADSPGAFSREGFDRLMARKKISARLHLRYCG